jgi:DNA modification methylase
MTVSLHLGDCLDYMRTMPAGSVDMVFADPPFNVGVKYAGKAGNDDRADYPEWCSAWIAECFRILKPTGTFYLMTITRHLEHIYPSMKAHGVFINQVNWRNVSSTNSKRCFWNEYQPILVYGKTVEYKFNQYAQTRKISKANMRWGGYTTEPKGQLLDYWNDIPFVYAGSIAHSEAILKPGTNEKAHPAQMPVDLPARAILFSTDEGDIILDPFNGSGSTGIACVNLNRNYIGIDCEPEYIEMTKKRIEQAALQPQLFTEPKQPDEKQGGLFDV